MPHAWKCKHPFSGAPQYRISLTISANNAGFLCFWQAGYTAKLKIETAYGDIRANVVLTEAALTPANAEKLSDVLLQEFNKVTLFDRTLVEYDIKITDSTQPQTQSFIDSRSKCLAGEAVRAFTAGLNQFLQWRGSTNHIQAGRRANTVSQSPANQTD